MLRNYILECNRDLLAHIYQTVVDVAMERRLGDEYLEANSPLRVQGVSAIPYPDLLDVTLRLLVKYQHQTVTLNLFARKQGGDVL